eukprot:4755410-Pleurochrysis_carterae.AAC.2
MTLQFSPALESALASLNPSSDPLDEPDFNPTAHINKLFPSEDALARIDSYATELESTLTALDEEVGRKHAYFYSSVAGSICKQPEARFMTPASPQMFKSLFGAEGLVVRSTENRPSRMRLRRPRLASASSAPAHIALALHAQMTNAWFRTQRVHRETSVTLAVTRLDVRDSRRGSLMGFTKNHMHHRSKSACNPTLSRIPESMHLHFFLVDFLTSPALEIAVELRLFHFVILRISQFPHTHATKCGSALAQAGTSIPSSVQTRAHACE